MVILCFERFYVALTASKRGVFRQVCARIELILKWWRAVAKSEELEWQNECWGEIRQMLAVNPASDTLWNGVWTSQPRGCLSFLLTVNQYEFEFWITPEDAFRDPFEHVGWLLVLPEVPGSMFWTILLFLTLMIVSRSLLKTCSSVVTQGCLCFIMMKCKNYTCSGAWNPS